MGFPEWVSRFKESHTVIKRIKGHYYKYEVIYQYDKETKRSKRKTVKLLGKITEKDGFVPSPKNMLREIIQKPRNVDTKMYGVFALFEELLADEIRSLPTVFDQETVEQLLVFAMMRWSRQSPIKRLAHYHEQDFCSESWCKDFRLTDKKITETLKKVGENRNKIVQWMRALLPVSSEKSGNFMLMDSTHAISSSEHLTASVLGHNSDGFDKQIRLMYLFSPVIKKPIYYRLVNGNIPDVSSMKLCLQEMELDDAIMVADKGFYSAKNIKELKGQNLQYVIPIPRSSKLIDYTPLENGALKKSRQFFVYQKRIIWYNSYEKDGQKFITFLDDRLRTDEECIFLQTDKEKLDELSDEEFAHKLSTFGTLTLTYDIKIPKTPKELYEIYKQRNEIEAMFDAYKNFLEADKTYMQNNFVLEGWLFVNFLAMIAYYRLYGKLREEKLLTKISPKDVVEWAMSIYKLKINGQWHISEIPRKLKDIFAKLKVAALT